MSGADSTTEVTPTGRYEDHSLFIASRLSTAKSVTGDSFVAYALNPKLEIRNKSQ